MDHSDHTHLHMTCDAEKDVYQNQMDKLYATIKFVAPVVSLGARLQKR